VGEIVACWVAEEALLGNGKWDSKKIDPFVFTLSGEYFGIGEFLGPSYGVGKKLLEK
jgi:hypothetical protein